MAREDRHGRQLPPPPRRRLVVNADDFGLSRSINAAVMRAHRDGILTTASLMVNEPATADAVALAREHPELGVGLHLTLILGHSALPAARIPGLVNARGEFGVNPVGAGWRYFVARRLHTQLRDELQAQFERFHKTGLTLDHVNGHLHLHLHPAVFSILMENASAWGISRLRLTWDPFWLNARLASGQWLYRGVHAALYHVLSRRARPALRQRSIQHTDVVFGLLQNARVDEDYVAKLLPRLPPGDSELYSHPSLDEFRNELEALISPRVKELVRDQDIDLIRYQDL
jgi:hopanoid biosynthesis associated protein HpnK